MGRLSTECNVWENVQNRPLFWAGYVGGCISTLLALNKGPGKDNYYLVSFLPPFDICSLGSCVGGKARVTFGNDLGKGIPNWLRGFLIKWHTTGVVEKLFRVSAVMHAFTYLCTFCIVFDIYFVKKIAAHIKHCPSFYCVCGCDKPCEVSWPTSESISSTTVYEANLISFQMFQIIIGDKIGN